MLILVVSVVSGLVVILLIKQNFRVGFIVVVLMCLCIMVLPCWDTFACRTCIGHNYTAEE